MMWRIFVEGDVTWRVIEMDGGNVEVGNASAFGDEWEEGNRFAVLGVMGLLVQDKTRRMSGRSRWCRRHGTVFNAFAFELTIAVDAGRVGVGFGSLVHIAKSRKIAMRAQNNQNNTSILPSM